MKLELVALCLTTIARSASAQEPVVEAPYCAGDYSDDLGKLIPKARELEQKPYSYCVRNTAIYECLSYSADGSVRRIRKKAAMYGTAFGYRQQAGETLFLTNEHVAEWPVVTDDNHRVDGVPAGCKRISDSLRLVDNESDDYDLDDVALSRVVVDPQLDAAVLRAKGILPVLPWKMGKSATLRERNVVEVRGFPLGAFQATNVGKVITAYDHDDEREWDHDDFVIDAFLSAGNSGSPVLAVSCKTGEFELVGLFHAGYKEGSALNVVVGIDQLRDLMTTLRRSPRARAEATDDLDATRREQLVSQLKTAADASFPFGSLVATVKRRMDEALVFEVFSRDFPFQNIPMFAFEDLASDGSSFGELGRIWLGSDTGMKTFTRSQLDADAQAQVAKMVEAIRRDALAFLSYRGLLRTETSSREEYQRTARVGRSLRRVMTAHRELSSAISDLADRLGPHASDAVRSVAELMVPLPILPHPIAQLPSMVRQPDRQLKKEQRE